MAWQHRKSLSNYARGAALQTQRVLDLEPGSLKERGIQGLILDFDGVLAAHSESRPLASVEVWLQKAVEAFGSRKLFILSNQPTAARVAYFDHYFPGIEVVFAKRKKPFSDGLIFVVNLLGVAPQSVLLLDDRLLTGILAAVIMGVQGCYVRKGCVCWKNRPLIETWYSLLRVLERFLFGMV